MSRVGATHRCPGLEPGGLHPPYLTLRNPRFTIAATPYSLRSGVAQGWPSSRQIADNERPGVEHPNPGAVRGRTQQRSGGVNVIIWRFGPFIASISTIGLAMVSGSSGAAAARRIRLDPNIILIMSDDQGYGDLGYHGNPRIRTPNLDQFARESVRLKTFCVSPVCSPTRASLMTGRYNYRTGVVDTYLGRSLMRADEVTLAEMLAAAGYRTGIFGKWHLGDNAPMCLIDQGFHKALVIKGDGLRPGLRPAGGEGYFDPILQENGQPRKMTGYCSDIYTRAAIDFLAAADDRPFFAYLAFNCPHEPLKAPESELAGYRNVNLSPSAFPKLGHPIPEAKLSPPEDIARLYAMVTNIDANVGRLLEALAFAASPRIRSSSS